MSVWLVGGFKHFLCSPRSLGGMIQVDSYCSKGLKPATSFVFLSEIFFGWWRIVFVISKDALYFVEQYGSWCTWYKLPYLLSCHIIPLVFVWSCWELRSMFFFWELGRHGCNCLMAGAAIPVRSRAVKWRSPRHGREWLSTFPFLVCWWWILGDGEQGNSVQSKGSLSIDTWHYHDVGSK